MKLLSKTLARILGKEGEADLIVFNQGEKYEFAECGECGAEIEREYPDRCPKCGAIFNRMLKAEEVE